MKMLYQFSFFRLYLLLAAATILRPAVGADKAVTDTKNAVVAIMGAAQLSRDNGRFTALKPGTDLRPGDVVRTATRSALDLHLTGLPGTLRLTQSSTLILEQIQPADGSDRNNRAIHLTLEKGDMLGLTSSAPAASPLEIKVSCGIARVFHGRFRIDARGYLILLKGKALFAHVPTEKPAEVITLEAPEAVYFSPSGGVKPVPKELKREVNQQMQSKLPKR